MLGKFREGSGKFKGRFKDGSEKVKGRLREGSGKVPKTVQKKVPKRVSGKV